MSEDRQQRRTDEDELMRMRLTGDAELGDVLANAVFVDADQYETREQIRNGLDECLLHNEPAQFLPQVSIVGGEAQLWSDSLGDREKAQAVAIGRLTRKDYSSHEEYEELMAIATLRRDGLEDFGWNTYLGGGRPGFHPGLIHDEKLECAYLPLFRMKLLFDWIAKNPDRDEFVRSELAQIERQFFERAGTTESSAEALHAVAAMGELMVFSELGSSFQPFERATLFLLSYESELLRLYDGILGEPNALHGLLRRLLDMQGFEFQRQHSQGKQILHNMDYFWEELKMYFGLVYGWRREIEEGQVMSRKRTFKRNGSAGVFDQAAIDDEYEQRILAAMSDEEFNVALAEVDSGEMSRWQRLMGWLASLVGK